MKSVNLLMVLVLMLVWTGSARADLLGYWALDGDAIDSSGNGHDGTINGNVQPAPDRFGNPSGAMSFAGGGGDNINVGNPPEFQMSGAMTIAAWVYLDSTNPLHGARNSRIVGKMGAGGRRAFSTGIEKSANNVPFATMMQVASNASSIVGLTQSPSMPLDRWVHYTAVFTPGTSLEVYLDGQLAAIRTDGIPATQYNTNNQPVLIGNRPEASDCGWYGFLDEVRIYDEALSKSRIESVMWGLSAGNPDPAHRAERVAVDTVLSWRAPDAEWLFDPNDADEVQYIIYFDPNELLVTERDESVKFGPQYETLLVPGDLEVMTTYYWRVDVIDPNSGSPITYPGVVWSFTTLPPKAGLLFPANGAVDVARNAVLEWDAGFGAIAHDVYFSTDPDLVASGDASAYVGRQPETFLSTDLDWQTQYFWRVDEVFAASIEQGDVWSFTTGAAVCEYPLSGDVNNDCIVNLEDLAIIAGNWLICNLVNGDCP